MRLPQWQMCYLSVLIFSGFEDVAASVEDLAVRFSYFAAANPTTGRRTSYPHRGCGMRCSDKCVFHHRSPCARACPSEGWGASVVNDGPSCMINQKIRSLRELKKLQHEDVAARLGITQHAYSRIETGESKLDVARLQRIAEVLEVAVEDLMNPDPLVLTIHQSNTGGTNGYNRHVENHLSDEFLQRITERY